MENEQKLEEQMIDDINENCVETDEEFIEVIGDADEVINEVEDGEK